LLSKRKILNTVQMGMKIIQGETTMTEKFEKDDLEAYTAKVLREENRYFQAVTVTGVNGICPYGHKVGDVFKITSMNSDNICGSLLKNIFPSVIVKHYGGSLLWETPALPVKGCCAEDGKVEVEIRPIERTENVLLKTPFQTRDMTGRGYPALDKYRLFVEVRDIAVNCNWGHKIGDVFEVDPFNVGGACCFLYCQLYPYLHVLLSGASPPWAFEEKTVSGECPDTYDRLCYRLFLKERRDPVC